MKRKSIILLSSILAGSLLVGGAFATYAVTDNADPFGINVTPGDLEEDQETEYVTLSWGQGTSLQSLSNIEVGRPNLVGKVKLKSSIAYKGEFTLKLRDNSDQDVKDARTEDSPLLLDYLVVKVYQDLSTPGVDGTLPSGTPLATLGLDAEADESGNKVLSETIENPVDGTELTIYVTLDSSAAGSTFEAISKDKVYLEVDWGKGPNSAEGSFVYFSKPSDWENLKLYAWSGSASNGSGGVNMVLLYDDIYQGFVPEELTNFEFNDGTPTNKVGPLTLEGYDEETPYWNATKSLWEEIPENTTVNYAATLNGAATTLEVFRVLSNENNAGEYAKVLAADSKLTFTYGYEVIHFYDGDNNDLGTTFTAQEDGYYIFYLTSEHKMYSTHNPLYYVVGTFNEWTAPNDYRLVLNLDNPGEYMTAAPISLTEADGLKVKTSGDEWFPAGETPNYTVEASGDYNIYFRPEGGQDGWHEGYFYVAAVTSQS